MHKRIDIHFLDVGHGDCTIIDFPDHLTVIDINNCKKLAFDSRAEIRHKHRPMVMPFSGQGPLMNVLYAEKYVKDAEDRLTDPLQYLQKHFAGRSIFRYIQTHPDMDHMAGIARLFNEWPVENFWDTAHSIEKDEDGFKSADVNFSKDDWHAYQDIRKGNRNQTVLRPTTGTQNIYYADDGIRIFAPFDHSYANDSNADPNALSYVLLIQVEQCNILLGGDATVETWDQLYKAFNGNMPKIHLLKASHHGRKSGYHREAVKSMNPDLTILSVGELKAKDDAEASYERYSNVGCYSTLDHGDLVATCWYDGDIWLRDSNGKELKRTKSLAAGA